MVRFFFHLHEGDGVTEDFEGQLLTDSASAKLVAIQSARQIMSHQIADGVLDLTGGIEVVNGDTNRPFLVSFREVVEVIG
jgi:uncharacterized protein DUF6894